MTEAANDPMLGPVEGYRLEDALAHPFVVAPMHTHPPDASELTRLSSAVAWWRHFAAEVCQDYTAQQARLQRPMYLRTADGAYASRVSAWALHVGLELAWRCDEGNRAAVRRVSAGTGSDADRTRVTGRPTAPESARPRWRDAPPDWPVAVSCEARVAAFYRARVDAYRQQKTPTA